MLFEDFFLGNLLAQATGTAGTIDLLNQTVTLTRNTVEAWNELWQDTISAQSPLWQSLSNLGLSLAGISLLYVTIKELKEILEKSSWSSLAGLFVMPMVVVIMLGQNSTLGAGTVQAIRAIGYGQVTAVLQQQVLGTTINASLQEIRGQSAARERLIELYGECQALPPTQRTECLNDPNKAAAAGEILNQLGAEQARSFSPQGFLNFLTGDFIAAIKVLLYAVQWAFVNCLEAALLLTALFFPIALGLSILPLAGKPIFAWGSAMLGLFAVQMGYNITVGLVATVLINATEQTNGFDSFQDLAFATFLAIFSPWLAVTIGKGGGIALFQGIQQRAVGIIRGAADAVGAAALVGAKFAIKSGFFSRR